MESKHTIDKHRLERASALHLRLLHAVDTFPGDGGLYGGPALQNALRRYEACWLPLLADVLARTPQSATKLVPPLDVAWVWHLHRLNPRAYKADCKRLFGRLLALPDELRGFRFSDGVDRQSAQTRILWRRFKEPFAAPTAVGPQPEFKSTLTHDIAAAASLQPDFLKQVLRYPYTTKAFVRAAIDRYERFLLLKEARPVPLVDIDFIWHAHLAMPTSYQADCQALVGFLVTHGESNDAASDLGQAEGFESTERAWTSLYPGQPYKVPHSERLPEDCKNITAHLFRLPYLIRDHKVVIARLQTVFGDDFLEARGGGLLLFLLNGRGALESVVHKRQTAGTLPHSSADGYWRRGWFGTRDMNRISKHVVQRYVKSSPDIAKRPQAVLESWRLWFPMESVFPATQVSPPPAICPVTPGNCGPHGHHHHGHGGGHSGGSHVGGIHHGHLGGIHHGHIGHFGGGHHAHFGGSAACCGGGGGGGGGGGVGC